MLDEPQVANKYGGTIAAPVVGSIIEECLEYMGVERQYTVEEVQTVSVTVPDLRELTVAEAKTNIDSKKLNLRVIGKGDRVVDQLPKPGVNIGENSTIIVYTEERDENKKVVVPDVTGLTVSQAKKRITDAGLNFEIAGAGLTSEDGAYAFKQSVPGGTQVEPATVVSVEFRHASSD
jgi:stage V sporulation protein D (sporulation-specific penicillin-binding protein)